MTPRNDPVRTDQPYLRVGHHNGPGGTDEAAVEAPGASESLSWG
jgi:hypothetical protein